MDEIKLIEKWVAENTKIEVIKKHYLATNEYLLKLEPAASKELQIAALTHDIERSFPNSVDQSGRSCDDYTYLLLHGTASAEIVLKKINELRLDIDFYKIYSLIQRHELGGDFETDLLKDADSLSFLKILPDFLMSIWEKERVVKKINYMYDRITLPKAKIMARKILKIL